MLFLCFYYLLIITILLLFITIHLFILVTCNREFLREFAQIKSLNLKLWPDQNHPISHRCLNQEKYYQALDHDEESSTAFQQITIIFPLPTSFHSHHQYELYLAFYDNCIKPIQSNARPSKRTPQAYSHYWLCISLSIIASLHHRNAPL